MAQVLAAIDALELQANFRSQVPSIEEVDFNTYLNFNKDVEHYCTVLRVRNSRRAQGYSVRFDAVAKEKVNHHLTQLRDIFNKLEMEGKKKESLLFKLEDLQREIDSSRTRFDRFAALAIEASTLTGDVVEKSKVLEIFDSIARVFWGAQTDRQKQLPSPQAPKQIPGPKRFPAPSHSESKTSPNSMDDDIPF
jgi:hypothetical protein